MKRFSDRHQLTTLSELNVTPLLDLAFVLLIIFMITTPLMENSSELVVPSSKRSDSEVSPSDVETISIDREGLVKLNNVVAEGDALSAALASLKAGRPTVAVVVRAHKELPVQKLIDVMDSLKVAGITKIGVVSLEAQ